MIEHFEKFNDYGKGLLPLSFSHLNEFAFYRERWALRRIFGYQFPTSAPAIRGQVVESGINMFLNGIPIEEASEKMIAEYDANCLEINDPKIDDERANLVPLLELGTKTFQEYAYRWTLLNYQKKVELDIKGIPFIGYTDFHFEDKNTKEDFFIDFMMACPNKEPVPVIPITVNLSIFLIVDSNNAFYKYYESLNL